MCAPKTWSSAPTARVSASRGVEFETPLAGRHGVMNLLAAIAVARRLRDRARAAARRGRARFAAGKMRGERIEHDGIVIWNDCYNSNPEAAQSMLDVLRGDAGARGASRCWGRCSNLGAAAEALHREVGRYAAGARSGSAGWGARRGARHGGSRGGRPAARARTFSTMPAEAGEFARAGGARRATRCCSRDRAACGWSGRWKGFWR